MQKLNVMDIINLILILWFIAVGMIVLFVIGERTTTIWPTTKFAKWWRKHVVSLVDPDDEEF